MLNGTSRRYSQRERVKCGNDDGGGAAVTPVATFEHVHSILVVASKRT